jgi:hypothetical protein
MEATIEAKSKNPAGVSSLVVVPSGIDRSREGYRLAAPMISDDPHERGLVLRGQHPDLLLLDPSTGKEKIGIDQVKAMIRSAQFTPVQGKRKVCLIPHAEALTLEAANALLKVLEEPPRRLNFLLLVEQPSDVLPTILSRSQVVRGVRPGMWDRLGQLAKAGYSVEERYYLQSAVGCEEELDRFLETKQDLTALRERALSQLEEASYDTLVAAASSEDPILRYEGVSALFVRLVEGDSELAVTAAKRLAQKGKGVVSRLLVDCLHLGYGLLRRVVDEEASRVPGEALLPALSRSMSTGALLRLLRLIEHNHRAVERYAPLEACLLVVFLEVTRREDG